MWYGVCGENDSADDELTLSFEARSVKASFIFIDLLR